MQGAKDEGEMRGEKDRADGEWMADITILTGWQQSEITQVRGMTLPDARETGGGEGECSCHVLVLKNKN